MERQKIGWIGIGVMGSAMAGHLQAAGHDLFVFNRTRTKAEPLLEKGARWCASPADVARQAEIVFTMVGLPEDVEEVYLGEDGILSEPSNARIVVDMTTSEPALAQTLAEEAASAGIESLDAPVSGGDVGARNGTLAIMVGGNGEAFEEVLPLFEIMGENIVLMGGPGAGQHTKMCNQVLVAGTMIGVCESLLYAVKQGLDPQAVIDIIGKGAAGSWSINNLGPRIVQGNFDPGFFVEHFIKDMGIALKESAASGIALPGLALVHQLYLALQAQGHGRSGTQALYLALKSLNGMA
ncbi:MAG: NAD(P)-dependent oxidoreductase [Desulfobacteraceae bacterium]|jgi:3-hydroxyisobutyrate dehydrogenase